MTVAGEDLAATSMTLADMFTVWPAADVPIGCLGGFGVAHIIEASDFDQLASENSLQALVAVKVDGRIIFFDR